MKNIHDVKKSQNADLKNKILELIEREHYYVVKYRNENPDHSESVSRSEFYHLGKMTGFEEIAYTLGATTGETNEAMSKGTQRWMDDRASQLQKAAAAGGAE